MILVYSSFSSFPFFIEDSDARCKNGYHKSPSGDCEKVTNTKGMPRCPDGFHKSPDGDCESVTDDNDEDEDNDKDEDKDDDLYEISDRRKSITDDSSFLFPNTFESEFNSNEDIGTNENLASNSEVDDNSIPSNIIDDIMRKHQQFAFTLGNPSSDILSTGDSKGYYQKYYNGYILWHPQFGAHEVHGGIAEKWKNLGGENGGLESQFRHSTRVVYNWFL